MADPTRYHPHFNYSGWEAAGPKRPKPGAELDIDFANIARSVDETIDALKDIRRSDGKLKNGIVDKDALDESARELWESADLAAENAKGSAQSAAGSAASAAKSAEAARGYASDAVSQGNVPIYASVATVEVLNINPNITALRTNGYSTPGDGGGGQYRRKLAIEVDEPGDIPSSDGSRWGLFENRPNARQFGAVGDGVTNDTEAMQNMFDFARLKECQWHIPNGNFHVTTVTAYTGGDCSGELVTENEGNDGAFVVATHEDDVEDISVATVNSWTNKVRGSTNLIGLSGRKGQFIYIDTSDDIVINRRNGDPMRQGDSFTVTNDSGVISPALFTTWKSSLASATAKAKPLGSVITITGLTVRVNSGSGERSACFNVSRPNTTLVSCHAINDTGTPVKQGFRTEYCCGVTYVGCTVNGLQVNSTNYGFNFHLSHTITLLNCSTTNCRRSTDGHRAKNIQVLGGNFPSGVGAHYAWGYKVWGASIGSDNDQNPNPCNFSGGDIVIRDCEISVGSGGMRAFNARADYWELGGRLILEGNHIVFEEGAGDAADVVSIANLRGPNGGYDPGRAVEMPSLISICGNTIEMRGSSSPNAIEALDFLQNWSAADFPQDIRTQGTIEISGNSWIIDNDARADVTMFKPKTATGDGYTIHLSDIHGLTCYFYTAADNVTSGARHDVYVERISGDCVINAAYGATRRVISSVPGTILGMPGGTSGYTPIGDEVRAVVPDGTFQLTGQGHVDVFGPDGARAARFHDVENAVNFIGLMPAEDGTAPAIHAWGDAPNIDLALVPRGSSGRVQFGEHSAVTSETVTGFIRIKDSSGEVRKLAVVS